MEHGESFRSAIPFRSGNYTNPVGRALAPVGVLDSPKNKDVIQADVM